MSKEIFLYSADNKYQAYVELADNTDRFGCPDHSFFKLIENRNDDKLYLIAEARDGLLETEKDQRIAELEQELAEMTRKYEFSCRPVGGLVDTAINLEKELAELKEKAIVPRFKKGDTAYAIIDTTFYTDIFKVNVLDTELCYRVDRGNNDISTQHHTRLFATEQEAQAKLKEIQGNE